MAKKFSELRDKMSPERRAAVEFRVQEALAEMPLSDLRRARDYTQVTLAKAMETTQGEVSKIEARTDCYVSTLRNYINAMGGDLEIVARFADGTTIQINQFSDLDTPAQVLAKAVSAPVEKKRQRRRRHPSRNEARI